MIHFTKEVIQNMDRIKRLNIINSISGIKPANLIGTVSDDGNPNVAIFSSIVHLGSNPAILGFILRPDAKVRRHTYENIQQNGFYTINHVHQSFIEQAHYTSAKFDADVSEFEECQLTEQYLFGFKAPFVKESHLKLAMRFLQAVPITVNNTIMVVGEVEHILLPNVAMDARGHIDLSIMEDVGISGLNSYYSLKKIAQFPYARATEIPDFSSKEYKLESSGV